MEIKSHAELVISNLKKFGAPDEDTVTRIRENQNYREREYLELTKRARDKFLPDDMDDPHKKKLTIGIINLIHLRIFQAPGEDAMRDQIKPKLEELDSRRERDKHILENLTHILDSDQEAPYPFSVSYVLDGELKKAGKTRGEFNEMLKILGKASNFNWNKYIESNPALQLPASMNGLNWDANLKSKVGSPGTAVNKAIKEVADMMPNSMNTNKKAQFIKRCLEILGEGKSKGAIYQVISDHKKSKFR